MTVGDGPFGSKFTVPLTFSVYQPSVTNNDGTVVPGRLITTVTEPFAIPYRPSANLSKCTGSDDGKWYSVADNACYNGKAFNVSLNFASLALTLPDTVVVSLAYDTTHYGANPIGESAACFGTPAGCAYDSLNVGVGEGAPTVGSKPRPDTVFQSTVSRGSLCDNTPTLGVFNLDSPSSACWAPYTPDIKVTTTGAPPA